MPVKQSYPYFILDSFLSCLAYNLQSIHIDKNVETLSWVHFHFEINFRQHKVSLRTKLCIKAESLFVDFTHLSKVTHHYRTRTRQ